VEERVGGRPIADSEGPERAEPADLRPKQPAAMRILDSADGKSIRQVRTQHHLRWGSL